MLENCYFSNTGILLFIVWEVFDMHWLYLKELLLSEATKEWAGVCFLLDKTEFPICCPAVTCQLQNC